jgi:hypothetical protein
VLPAVAFVAIGAAVDRHVPVRHWLFWRYASYWVAALVWAASCFSAGDFVVARVRGRRLPMLEHLATALPIGVLAFELVMFVVGSFGGYSPVVFFLVPAALLALGGRGTFRWLRRALRHVRRARPWSVLDTLGVAFGALALLLVYVAVMSPENVQFDALWKHIAIAEDYVVSGGIRRFPEGWTVATRPHFTSFLYTWAFLAPGGELFDHLELCAHLEMVVFLWTTLFGIGAIVRRLVPGADPRIVWVARFLFPGILVYDSGLSAGADHVAAAFVVPLYLLLSRAWRRLDPALCALLGATAAGAVLCKETVAVMVLPGAMVVIGARAVWLAYRDPWGWRVMWGPLCSAGVALAVLGPPWLETWRAYGSPVYPVLPAVFTPNPWTADASYLYEFVGKEVFWRPERSLGGLLESLRVLWTFSFEPHDWSAYHGKVPVFGFLYTVLLPGLLFLKGARRIWPLVLWTEVGIFSWFWLHHQDRYLQALMPWMAAVTAAIVVLAWRQGGRLGRLSLSALMLLQVVWGGDMAFLPTHAMTNRSPIVQTATMLGQGYEGRHDARLRVQATMVDMGARVPEDALVLLHETRTSVGLGRRRAMDYVWNQFGISYGLLHSAREVYEHLKGLGITHVAWRREHSDGWDSIAGDLRFWSFARRYTTHPVRIGEYTIATMPSEPPPDAEEDTVLVVGCGGGYESGLYRLDDTSVPAFGPAKTYFPDPEIPTDDRPSLERLAPYATYVVAQRGCGSRLPLAPSLGFSLLAKRQRAPGGDSTYELWMRRQGEGRGLDSAYDELFKHAEGTLP